MTLSIIIVNWNVKDLLEKCLTSVYKETQNLDFEVIVVDNASSDGSVEMIKEKFPKVRLIANKKNRWFAGGNNQGFAEARGELILMLNPDTEILDGAIGKMAEIMSGKIPLNPPLQKGEISAIGILGCKLLNPDMTLQPSCRRLPRLTDQILILLKLHNFFPWLKPIREYYMSDYKHNDTREVEQVMGACLMARKEIIDKIGGLDEKYVSIFEEVDFCKRVTDAGWKICFTDKARVVHYKGQSFRQRKIIVNQKNFNHALLRYFKKHKPYWQYLILSGLWPVSMALASADQLMILAGLKGFKTKFKRREM